MHPLLDPYLLQVSVLGQRSILFQVIYTLGKPNDVPTDTTRYCDKDPYLATIYNNETQAVQLSNQFYDLLTTGFFGLLDGYYPELNTFEGCQCINIVFSN